MQPCTVCLGASCSNGHRQLATFNRFYVEYNKNLILIWKQVCSQVSKNTGLTSNFFEKTRYFWKRWLKIRSFPAVNSNCFQKLPYVTICRVDNIFDLCFYITFTLHLTLLRILRRNNIACKKMKSLSVVTLPTQYHEHSGWGGILCTLLSVTSARTQSICLFFFVLYRFVVMIEGQRYELRISNLFH